MVKSVIYEPRAGDGLEHVVNECIKLSKLNSSNVRFTFNAVMMEVTPETKTDEAVQFYLDESQRQPTESKQAAADTLRRQEERTRHDAAIDQKIAGITLDLADQACWDRFVAKNKEGYGKGMMDYAERWAKLMQAELAAGKKLSEIAATTSHEADNSGIVAYQYAGAVLTLSQTWKHGEQLRQWHNQEMQLKDEGNIANAKGGVLNPSMLRIR